MSQNGFVGEKDDILSLARWIFRFSQIFGYWSFSVDEIEINRKKSYIVKMKLSDWIRAIAMPTVYLVVIFIRYLTIGVLFEGYEMKFIEMILNEMTVSSSAVMAIFTIVMNVINRKAVWKLIMMYNYMDEKVNESSNELYWFTMDHKIILDANDALRIGCEAA